MSKSTKWMKKGFAWLLCLIMMTGMLSSAAVAGPDKPDAQPPKEAEAKITFDNKEFKDYTWEDPKDISKLPEFGFSFSVEKPGNLDNQNWTAEAHWFIKTSQDTSFKEVFLNKTTNGYQETFYENPNQKNLIFYGNNKTENLYAGIRLETADEARQAGEYKCVIIIKHNGEVNTQAENTKTVKVIHKVTLTFDYPTEKDKTIKLKGGEKIKAADKPADPKNNDSTKVFDGWVYQGTTEKLDLDAPVTKGGTLVPSWKITVTLVYGSGSSPHGLKNSTEKITILANSTLKAYGDANGYDLLKPICTRAGRKHTFLGWYTKKDGGEEVALTDAIGASRTLYARWGFRVDFDVALDGVEKIPAQVFGENGGNLKRPEDPKHNDYVFKGWAVEGSDKLYTFTNTTITDSFTLVAQWEKKVVKQAIGLKWRTNVTYNGKNQSAEIVDADGNTITIPSSAYYITYTNISAGAVETSETKNAGVLYSATLNLTDEGSNNYYIIDGKDGGTLWISPKPIEGITWDTDGLEYDAKEHYPKATAVGICDGDTCVLSVTGAQTKAGENYTARVDGISNNNYYIPDDLDVTTFFSIAKRPVTIIWDDDTDLIYNGTERTPGYKVIGLLGSATDGVVANVTGGVVLGSSTATIVFEGAVSNYELPDNTSIAFTVSRLERKLELKGKKDSVPYGEHFDITCELIPEVTNSKISVESKDTKVATASYNKKTGKITINAVGIGSTTITVKVDAIGSYDEVTESFDLTVTPIQPKITLLNTQNSVQYGNSFVFSYKLEDNSRNDVQVTCNSDAVTIVIDRTKRTVTVTGSDVGEAVITLSLGESAHHYSAVSEPLNVNVTKRKVTIEWSKDPLVYDGTPQLPQYKVLNVIGDDDIKLVVTGAQTDAGKNYLAVATIDNDNYTLDSKTAQKSFSIEKANSTITASNIKKTYGEEPFAVSYDSITGGTDVTVEVQWNYGVAYLNRENKVVISGAGEAYIKLTNKGDKNHEESSVTIKLTVDKKKVPVVWDNPDDPEVFTWDGYSHCPTAHVDKSYLVGKDKCDVYVSGSTKNVGTFTARVTGLENTNYALDKEYSKKFTIKDVITSTKLTTSWQTKTLYYLGVNETEIQLNLTGINIVETFKSGAKDRITPVTSDMIDASFDPAKLGKQNVRVNYNNMEFTFEIQIIKRLEPVWGETKLTYNGEIQAPEFSVKGLKEGDSFDQVIKVTADKSALNVNKANTRYMATAEINKDFYDRYIFTDSHHHSYKYYTIAPKPVTLTWSFDGAAFKPSIFDEYDCDFFAGSEVLAPVGTIDDDDAGLVLAIYDADGNPVEKATLVGAYTIDASLTNSNYIFKDGTTDSVSFRIINKASSANISVLIPQCGQESAYSGFEIGFGVDYVRTGMKRVQLADLDMVVMNQNVAFVDASDEKTVFEEKAAPINWASLGQADANSTINVKGFLVPQIKGTFTDDESFFNAISSFEDDKVSVEGGTTYSVILILTADSMTGFDAKAIKENLKKAQKDLRYVVATEYGVVALVDVDAVHNYDEENPTIVEPEEGKAGSRTVKCYLGQGEDKQYNHDFKTSIDALEVTEIEVVKGEGFKDNYFVGDAFDYTGLKIKVYLSNGEEAFDKSYEKDVTKDDETITVSGFDSKEAGKKTITVTYGGKEAKFDITVSKKQSSIDLKNVGNEVTVTYGSAPIEITFDAENGNVVITSSDESVAKIEKNQVVAVGAGQAKITLKIEGTVAVEGSEKSFTLIVEQKVVGLSWSAENTYEEDGKTHCPSVKATELVGNDTCDVIVDGATAEVGTHTAKATGLSNPNYKLPAEITITFTITAKEQPKEDPKDEPKKDDPKDEPKKDDSKDDPKKDDPKEEPKKDKPKFTTVITIGSNFKTVYDKGDKFNPDGLTIEVVDENGKKTTVAVTEDMVKGFDSSKEGDIVITIQYEDASKEVPIKILSYNIKVFFDENGNLKIECHRSEDDSITFSLFLGARVDGKDIPKDAQKSWSGSLHMLVYADYIKSLAPGEHTLEILFKDGVAKTTFTVAATPASDASPVTGDTSSLTMWIILLAAAAAVLVAIRVYAAKRSNAE